MEFIKNSKGFTLVEVLVSLGLLGGLALWGMQSYEFMSKSNKTVLVKNEHEYILNDLREILGVSESCAANFKDWVVPPDVNNDPFVSKKISIIDQPGTAPVVRYIMSTDPSSAPSYGNKTIKLLGLKLSSDSSASIPPGASEGKTNVLIRFNFTDSKKFGVSEIVRKIPINVKINTADRKIVSCAAAGKIAALDNTFLKLEGGTMRGDIILADGYGINFLSDKRFKNSIQPISKISTRFDRLRAITFKWNKSEKLNYGFVAQEVASSFPSLSTELNDGTVIIKQVQMIPLSLKSLQERDQELRQVEQLSKIIEREQELMVKLMDKR